MKLNKMDYPLPQDVARCVGSGCDQKGMCKRYLSIEVDNVPYAWFADFKKELNNEEDKCDFFIEIYNNLVILFVLTSCLITCILNLYFSLMIQPTYHYRYCKKL